jgi:hypothetical protein
VVIDDFDILRFTFMEIETDPVLVVDTDGILPGAIAPQFFQLVANAQWVK